MSTSMLKKHEKVNGYMAASMVENEIVQDGNTNRSITLVTTDIWPDFLNVEDSYFLGTWCFASRNDVKRLKSAGRVIDYHWNNREKLNRDFKRLQMINEEILDELVIQLNKLHDLNESKDFWRLLLGYWLNIYTATVFDRWSSLKEAKKTEVPWKMASLHFEEHELAVIDTAEFITKVSESSKWNSYLFSLLAKYDTEIRVSLFNCPASIKDNLHCVPPIANHLKLTFKYVYAWMLNLLKSRDRFFLLNTYVHPRMRRRLEVMLGQIPLRWLDIARTKDTDYDRKFREWSMLPVQSKDEFEILIRELIPKLLPRVFLEGFSQLRFQASMLPWPNSPEVIFTSNSHFSNDLFKVWAARKIALGSRMIIGEHGGFGTGLFNGSHQYELSIANLYITTGWRDRRCEHTVPAGLFRVEVKKIKPNLTGNALLVCGNMPRFSFDMRSMMLSGQVLDYLENQFQFIDALPEIIRAKILVRLTPQDNGWEQKDRFLDRFPSISFDDLDLTMMEAARKCRLFIGTYNASTYLEPLSLNFPTVIFWNPLHWEVKPEAQPFFDKLREAEIFHESPESAAKHISKIWADIPAWWQSDKVQLARKLFCDAYATFPPDLIERIKDILLKEAKHSTIRTQYNKLE